MSLDDQQAEGSALLHKEPCPACRDQGGDSDGDNLGRYSDGHGYCFACGHYEKGEGAPAGASSSPSRRRAVSKDLITGVFRDLPSRRIDKETCALFGYMVNEDRGVHVANYRDEEGNIIAQKLRTPNKEMPWVGNSKDVVLFGQHLWKARGRTGIVVTEGEIDALTVSEAQGNKWPVVSIPKGANNAPDAIKKSLRWLEQFDTITLCFDMDEAGREAVDKCAHLFTPGKLRIAHLPMKDPSEMWVAGRGSDLLKCIANAKEWRPEGVVTLKDIKERVMRQPAQGLPWPWEGMTRITRGRRYCELYCFGAGVGMGKTDLLLEMVQYTAVDLNEKVGLFFLETPLEELATRLVGKHVSKQWHLPNEDGSEKDLTAFSADYDTVANCDNVYIFDNFGVMEWNVLRSYVRWMVLSKGIKHVVIDHLTALSAHAEDERRFLDGLLADLSALAKELNICMYLVSHLATPDGTPHEEGGRVYLRHFRGSRAIAQWVHYAFGLERDTQAENILYRRTTTVRCLKARFDGSKTGDKFYLRYDPVTGRTLEVEEPGFGDAHDDEEGFGGPTQF